MKALLELCTPRQCVFDRNRRDDVLDLTDLLEDCINSDEFFAENYATDGMRHLLREAFRRFAGQSAQGVFVLTQAMGGGKPHNMIALGLLGKHPELRPTIMGDLAEGIQAMKVRVVAFTGRESDAPFDIWGLLPSSWANTKPSKTTTLPCPPPDRQSGSDCSSASYSSSPPWPTSPAPWRASPLRSRVLSLRPRPRRGEIAAGRRRHPGHQGLVPVRQSGREAVLQERPEPGGQAQDHCRIVTANHRCGSCGNS